MRRTKSLVALAVVLIDDPTGRHWGYDLSRRSRLRGGILYPMLGRLLAAGWLADGWEDLSDAHGRPPRRYYTLTDLGRRELGAVASTVSNPTTTLLRPGWTQ
jgi:PadR family transcriptional regulator PadR